MGFCQAGYSKEVYNSLKYYNKKNKQNFKQPEDSLITFIQQDVYRKIAKGSFKDSDKYPEQSWNALVAASNDWMKQDIDYIKWKEPIETIKKKDTTYCRGVFFCL